MRRDFDECVSRARRGHRKTRGVEVERKWARNDYHPPGNGMVQIQTPAAAGRRG